MKLQHKIKSFFKMRDFHLWKDLRLDEGLSFAQPSEEILVEIAAYLLHLEPAQKLEDRRFRLKEKTAISFDSIDQILPWISKILTSDFEETAKESKLYDWDFRYQMKPHRTSENSCCLVNTLTSLKKQNSHCVYTLVSIRKFGSKFYCWTS